MWVENTANKIDVTPPERYVYVSLPQFECLPLDAAPSDIFAHSESMTKILLSTAQKLCFPRCSRRCQIMWLFGSANPVSSSASLLTCSKGICYHSLPWKLLLSNLSWSPDGGLFWDGCCPCVGGLTSLEVNVSSSWIARGLHGKCWCWWNTEVDILKSMVCLDGKSLNFC